MWTRSARKIETGKFTVTVTDWNGAEFFTGEFADHREADLAGETAERRMTLAMTTPEMPTLDSIFSEMDDDDLLRELSA